MGWKENLKVFHPLNEKSWSCTSFVVVHVCWGAVDILVPFYLFPLIHAQCFDKNLLGIPVCRITLIVTDRIQMELFGFDFSNLL